MYSYLQRIASAGDLTTYAEAGQIVGMDISSPVGRTEFGHIPDEINQYEHWAGRPMISAVVMLKGENIPGKGSFKCGTGLGRYDGHDYEAFRMQEVTRVHEYWKDHQATRHRALPRARPGFS